MKRIPLIIPLFLAFIVVAGLASTSRAIQESELTQTEIGYLAQAQSGASNFTVREDDLSPRETALLASLRQSNPGEESHFFITRKYLILALAATKSPIAAMNFKSRPAGFSQSCLLSGEVSLLNQAVTANVAAMAKALWA
jgi:hypothetical protein